MGPWGNPRLRDSFQQGRRQNYHLTWTHQVSWVQFHEVLGLNVNVGSFKNLPLASLFWLYVLSQHVSTLSREVGKERQICKPSRWRGRSWAKNSLPAFLWSASPTPYVYIHTFHIFISKGTSKEGYMVNQNQMLRSFIISIKFSSILE